MNRIVLITGASSGYGKATAKAFAAAGDTVIMAARSADKLEMAMREVGGHMAGCIINDTFPEFNFFSMAGIHETGFRYGTHYGKYTNKYGKYGKYGKYSRYENPKESE